MCNPPFYASIEDMFESAKQKNLPPSSVTAPLFHSYILLAAACFLTYTQACTGTTTEMVHEPGGEVAFVRRMFQESILLKFDPKFTNTWFTSMLGKHSSVETLVSEIRLLSQNYAITEFKQGLTRRWGIAWSWGDRRPGLSAARYDSSQLRSSMPFPPEFGVEIRGCSVETAGEMIDDLFGRNLSLKEWEWDQDEAVGWGNTTGNVWSRAARRALARNQGGEKEDAAVALGFRISVRARDDEDDVVGILVRWTRGTDPVLFESFCGMLKRKISQSFGA
jgi:23S rRNA (adenine1618-N6)-methyltransferase